MTNWITIAIILIINVLYWHITLSKIEFTETDSKFKRLMPSDKHYFIFILTIGIIGFLINKTFEIFCQPVVWAIITLFLILLSVGLYPIINKQSKYFGIFLGFIQGIGISTILYILIFGWDIFLIGLFIGIPFLAIGLILLPLNKKAIISRYTNPIAISMYEFYFATFSPLLIGFMIIKNFVKSKIAFKIATIIGFLCMIAIGLFYSNEYKIITKQINGLSVNQIISNKKLSSDLIDNYIGERIIGMHFKYHTEICLYDGWRPPLHDPFLVFAMWINKNQDPLPKYPLNDRLEIYKFLFPNNPIRENCSCADEYSKNYWTDKLLDMYDNKLNNR